MERAIALLTGGSTIRIRISNNPRVKKNIYMGAFAGKEVGAHAIKRNALGDFFIFRVGAEEHQISSAFAQVVDEVRPPLKKPSVT